MAISLELAGIFLSTSSRYSICAAFEAFPRNEQRGFLLGLVAGDERLHGGMRLDEPRQQRALVHVVEHGRNCSARVKSLMTSMSAVAVNSAINCWSSRMKSRRRLERFSLNWSRSIAVSMARKTSGPRMSTKSSVRSLPNHSSSSLLAACWLMRRASVSLSRSSLPPLTEHAGDFLGQLGGDGVQRVAQHFLPAVGIGLPCTIPARDDVWRREWIRAAART